MPKKKKPTHTIVRSTTESRLRVTDNSNYEMMYEIISDMLPSINLPYTQEHIEHILNSRDSYRSTKLEVLKSVIPHVLDYCDNQEMRAYSIFKRQINEIYNKIVEDGE